MRNSLKHETLNKKQLRSETMDGWIGQASPKNSKTFLDNSNILNFQLDSFDQDVFTR